MNKEAKKYDIRLFDQELTIISDESEEHVKRVVDYIEKSMREIAYQKSGDLSVKTIALLTALKITSQLMQKEEEYRCCERDMMQILNVIDTAHQSCDAPINK